VTELSRYNRNFNGLKAEMKGDKYDFNLFVTDTNQALSRMSARGRHLRPLPVVAPEYRRQFGKITMRAGIVKSEEVLTSQP